MTQDFSLLDLLLPYQRRFVLNDRRKKFFLASRQIGKSFCSAFLAVYEALRKNDSIVLVISTGSRSAQEFLVKAQKFCEAVKIMSGNTITYEKTADKIKFNTGSIIMSLPSGNPNSLRGYSAQCVLIDECFFIENPSDVMQAIAPTLTRDQESKLILCSTPGSKSSIFYDMYINAMQDDEWYCQTTNIEDAVKEGLDVDIDQLRKLCPDENIFRIEYMCQFPEGSGQLIDSRLLQFYVPSSDLFFVDYFIGIDFARTNDGTSICVLGRDRDGKCYLCDLIDLHNTEYQIQIDVIKSVYEKYRPICVYGDNGGLGNPLVEKLNKEVSQRIKGFNFTSTSKTPAYEYLRNMIFDRRLFISEEYRDKILNDFSLIQQIITDTGKIMYVSRRSNGSHGDLVSSLVLGLQAVRDNGVNHSLPITHSFKSRFNYFSRRR